MNNQDEMRQKVEAMRQRMAQAKATQESQEQPAADEDQPTKPAVVVRVTREQLEAEIILQRTGTNTADPVFEDLIAALREEGIVYGIDEAVLRQQCNRPEYNEVLVAARGTPPETGADGYLNYLVRTTRELRPKINEDGTADFKDLGYIQNVTEGQTLVEIFPPQKGADGCNVLGQVVEGIYGKPAPPCAGSNTKLNEDESKLLAAVSGNVEVRQGVVSVVDVMKINGNVDNSTGDINFIGDVIVQGDVISGFRVKSAGSIVVKGNVEGAALEAATDITINEGVNGMNRAELIAGGNVKCRYIQSSLIRTEGNIFADTLMYNTVECGGNVELSGKRAALIGGRASIAGRLSARTIGTASHTATEINMCATGMARDQEGQELEGRIRQIDGEITKHVQLMNRFDDIAKKTQLSDEQKKQVQTVKESYLNLTKMRKDTQAQLEKLRQEQIEASQANSFIECKDRIHSGVRMSFGPLIMNVTDSFVNSRIHVAKGEILVSTL